MKTFMPRKSGLIIILSLVVISLSLFLIRKSRVPTIPSDKIGIWYVASPDGEMLCWGNNVCGWSWTQNSTFDKTLITNAGILQKPYPSTVTSKKLITTVDKNTYEKLYSPLRSYVVSPNNIFYVIDSHLFQYNKKTGVNHELYNATPAYMFVASVRPDEQYLLVGTLKNNRKLNYFIYNLNTNMLGGEISTDKFEWAGSDSYLASLKTACDSSSFDSYRCSLNSGLLDCPEFPHLPESVREKYTDLLELSNELVLDIPDKWNFSGINYLIKTLSTPNQNTDSAYISWDRGCYFVDDNFYQNATSTFKVGDHQVYEKITPQSQLGAVPRGSSSTIATAKIINNKDVYTFTLKSSSVFSKQDNSLLIDQFNSLLNSIKFLRDYK